MSIHCAFCGSPQNSSLAHTTGIAYGKQTEQERLLALLDNEMNHCTCDDKLNHLRQRLAMIGVKGDSK